MKILDPEQPGKNYSLGCTSKHSKQLPTEYQRLRWQQQISLSCLRDSKYISVALELEQSKRMCLFWLFMWKTNASKGKAPSESIQPECSPRMKITPVQRAETGVLLTANTPAHAWVWGSGNTAKAPRVTWCSSKKHESTLHANFAITGCSW